VPKLGGLKCRKVTESVVESAGRCRFYGSDVMNKLPCLYDYMSSTRTGDRNTNMFKAINHLRHYNKTVRMDELVSEALVINKHLTNPLNPNEVTVICKHVMAKNYRTSCWKFKRHCRHCRYGEFRKLFRNSKPNYWKHINEHNRLINIKLLPDDKYYPWDILDTSKMTEENREKIQRFREEMGIPMAIDAIVKAYGIPIGKEARDEWENFKEEK